MSRRRSGRPVIGKQRELPRRQCIADGMGRPFEEDQHLHRRPVYIGLKTSFVQAWPLGVVILWKPTWELIFCLLEWDGV
jgi:hypothetical protein